MRERPIHKAIKDVLGPEATIEDYPCNRPILAGDLEEIKKAGQEAKKITVLTEAYSEPLWLRRAIKVGLTKIRVY